MQARHGHFGMMLMLLMMIGDGGGERSIVGG